MYALTLRPYSRPDGVLTRKWVSWTAGDHATGNPYYANGSALYNDTTWIASLMNASLTPNAADGRDGQRAVQAALVVQLQVSNTRGCCLSMC